MANGKKKDDAESTVTTTTVTTTVTTTTTTTETDCEDDDEDAPVKIPNIETFTIGTLNLVDVRTIAELEERKRVLQVGRGALEDLITRTRQSINCMKSFLNASDSALKEFIAANPRATPAEIKNFQDTVVLNDSECDLRLEAKALVVYQGDPVPRNLLGMFFLYNLKVVSSSRSLIEMTAYPAPGIPFTGDIDWVRVVRAVLKHGLEVSIPLADGRVLDIVAWEFPTRDSHAWTSSSAGLLIDELEADGFPREAVDGKLRRLSRS